MKYRLIFQPRALNDLEQQFNYVAQYSPEAAARWFSQFVKALELLKTFPERYSRARESELYGVEIRQLLYGKRGGMRRALFKIDGDTVRILCIRHALRGDASRNELFGE